MHLLVVDDDEAILQLVSIYLEQAGYHVERASNAEAALALLQKQQFDLLIIDVMMPGMDGFQLAKIVSKQYEIPMIMLTAKGQIEDKQKGFEQGIDDYMVKPFETKELLFRVNAILRRYRKSIQSQCMVGNVKLDIHSWDLTIMNKQYIWPLRELEILAYLLQRTDNNVNRWDLIDEIWGESLDQPEFTLNTHINRIRERLKRAGANIEIVTIRGFGYKLEVKE
ncbi:response regulator transcription factor [Bacillus sp. PS06]|uniref:response regulator transcription factor n=1 Tax=Bacillus sp. PS06 TaxID=2764176 RepID=UPI00177D504F|nr:response regulator transcription factor [Bacillus sp. PS06]MBD8070177.1 response regulator transcription factor [Bacillus sp. PS06]